MSDKITVSLVVSSSQNGVIGARGKKPWLLPRENQLIKELVLHKYIILGRKTFEAIDRRLIETCSIVVLSRKRDLRIPGVHVMHTLGDAIAAPMKAQANINEVFILGGASVFRQASLGLISRIYFTRINMNFSGDETFTLPAPGWRISETKRYERDANNMANIDTYVYDKV